MTPEKFAVWEWVDPETSEPVYVGVGAYENGLHPAQRLWDLRFKTDSTLNQWLRRFEHEPRRVNSIGVRALHRHAAYEYAAARREWLKNQGCTLLSGRDLETYAGGGMSRAVVDPNMEIYPSVRQAAEENGVTPATITRRCQTPSSGWRYLDEIVIENPELSK